MTCILYVTLVRTVKLRFVNVRKAWGDLLYLQHQTIYREKYGSSFDYDSDRQQAKKLFLLPPVLETYVNSLF